jgi:hypothetical protein
MALLFFGCEVELEEQVIITKPRWILRRGIGGESWESSFGLKEPYLRRRSRRRLPPAQAYYLV